MVKKKAVKRTTRRAPKESKSEGVDTSTGPQLLLGNMPPVKDLIYHLETIAGWQAKAKTAKGRVTDAKKKAREVGVDLNAIAQAMGFERMDPLELATQLRQLQVLMAERGLPVQMSLYEPKYGTVDEQAAAEGAAAGKAGRTPDGARWPEGAPGFVAYMRAWNDEQGVLAKKLGKGDTDS